MGLFEKRLWAIGDRLENGGRMTPKDRTFVHEAYWSGSKNEVVQALELISLDPRPIDLPILLDASALDTWWVSRCDVADALSSLPMEGPPLLKVMLERETHYVVRFWICRSLIDLRDGIMNPFLDSQIPSNSSPFQRSLWIYGNFERGHLTKQRALGYMTRLLEDPRSREDWLRDHINNS